MSRQPAEEFSARTEAPGASAESATPSTEAAARSQGSYEIVFELPDGSTHTVRCEADEHVLDAARRDGLELPSSCEQGWDMACAVRMLEGSVDNSDARRYFDEDREAGFALICTARPRSDLRLRTHQSEAMREHRRANGLPAPGGAWGSR